MTLLLETIITVLLPLSFVVLPGIAIVRLGKPQPLLIAAAMVVLWSLAIFTLGTLLATAIHLPLYYVWVACCLISVVAVPDLLKFKHRLHEEWLALLAIAIALFSLFALPFLTFHAGLPTGDSQKSILWASNIMTSESLPDYQTAVALLNRDPVDFFTPALHTLTALLMQLSPQALTAVGLFSIVLAISLAVIACGLARALFPRLHPISLTTLTLLLVLTQSRYLRYLREPGYHLQNLFGEVLLFGAMLLLVLLLNNWHKQRRLPLQQVILLCLLLLCLVFGHQFSAFLAAFILLPFALFGAYEAWHSSEKIPRLLVWLSGTGTAGLIAGGLALGLQEKIIHIFTFDAHLRSFTPGLLDYPRLMGTAWLTIGLVGLVFLVRYLPRAVSHHPAQAAFTASTLVLLALSQAPWIGIDIPPVRTLFYAVVPLSICGAAGLIFLARSTATTKKFPRGLAILILVFFLGGGQITSVTHAFVLSHTVRTNSTLTPGVVKLIDQLSTDTGAAILVDDFNRRSSSWLVLSGHPMFTRIASDLGQQMAEARQSELRYQLYLNQLDYEKIFSLGSLSLVSDLMSKQNVGFLTGISASSDSAFAHNPTLTKVTKQDDITIYRSLAGTDPCTERLAANTKAWLLRAATIANDIGDDEDTFLHLPASIRAPTLSAPDTDGICTLRYTSAPTIPLYFNIDDYVATLWDTNGTKHLDTAIEVLVKLSPPTSAVFIRDAAQELHPIPTNGIVRLQPHAVQIDEQGFISLTIINPNATLLGIDLIAIGPAHIP